MSMKKSWITGLILVLWASTALAFGPGTNNGSSMSNSFGLGNRSVSIKDYGAKADGIELQDGAVSAVQMSLGTSTSPSAPAVTTLVNNSYVVTVMPVAGQTLTPPGGLTTRVNQAVVGGKYNMFMGDQNVTNAGSVGAQTGTIVSADWATASIVLQPKGGTITTGTGSGWVNDCQAASAAACNINVPSNVQAGDLLLACEVVFNNTNVPAGTLPTNFTFIGQAYVVNHANLWCWQRTATNSEPGSYGFTSKASSGQSGFIIDYRNALVQGLTLNSSAATFTGKDCSSGSGCTGQVDKMACVGKAGANAVQACGNIISFIDSHDVALSALATSTTSGQPFAYATNDQTAVAAAVTAIDALVPPGGVINIPGLTGMSSDLNMPTSGHFIFQGVGAGDTTFFYVGPNLTYVGNPISGLLYLTNGEQTSSPFTHAGVYIQQGSPGPDVLSVSFRDMVIQAGVSPNYADGANGYGTAIDGVYAALPNLLELRNVAMSGWPRDCVNTPNSTQQPWQSFLVDQSSFMYCGQYGVVDYVQTSRISGNEFLEDGISKAAFSNLGSAVLLAAPGINVLNNTFNNGSGLVGITFASGGSLSGDGNGMIAANYNDTGTFVTNATSAAGYQFINNKGQLIVNYSAAGVPLPTATTYGHYIPVCVTDSTACTAGTTYVSGGSTLCAVQSDGTNWKETGSTLGCY